MTARFPRDEEYLQLHLEHYQEAFAAALFTGDYTQDDFRITVEDVVPLAAAEIAVNFKVRAPVTNVPADVASIPAMAAPVLAKMTVSDLNPKIAAKGLAEHRLRGRQRGSSAFSCVSGCVPMPMPAPKISAHALVPHATNSVAMSASSSSYKLNGCAMDTRAGAPKCGAAGSGK